jgi:hypothetical protein
VIISASRRTDIPAFYSKWFIHRIRQAYCSVPNPYNREQKKRVSLLASDVDVIVFWTRNPRSLLPYLDELDALGYRYYFQYTLLGYPPELDGRNPSLTTSLDTFRALAERISPQRVIWRYDPIVFSNRTDVDYHLAAYSRIAQTLDGYTQRSVISILDIYHKARKRLAQLKQKGFEMITDGDVLEEKIAALVPQLVQIASQHGMEVVSCAEEVDLRPYGVLPGKCVDDVYIQRVFAMDVPHTKDPSQREACGCVVSRDIGMYDTCMYRCAYCYATNFTRAEQNHIQYDPLADALG